MTYDHWKTTEPEEHASECDCCGRMQTGCVDIVAYGLDTHACPECRDAVDEDDEEADRGCYEYHFRRD